MDGAFFVGRKEIVDWINNTLVININRIEDTASGCIACQLLDIMHPGVLSMSKVNWAANKDFEYVGMCPCYWWNTYLISRFKMMNGLIVFHVWPPGNYKLLQTAFTKLSIDKYVDVDRLITGRYMDNLEFMQWFKRFFEMSVTDKGNYDCIAQRNKGRGKLRSCTNRFPFFSLPLATIQ